MAVAACGYSSGQMVVIGDTECPMAVLRGGAGGLELGKRRVAMSVAAY